MFATVVRLAPVCVSKPALRRGASALKFAPHRVASLGYPRPSVKARVNLKEDLESVDPGETKDALLNGDAGEKFQVAVGIGAKVAKGDKLLTMEAMKMQTTVYAAADGVVDKINVGIGESVESKDLIMELHEA